MTTTVTVTTHDWEVRVECINPSTEERYGYMEKNLDTGEEVLVLYPDVIVPRHSTQDFHIHNTMAVRVYEIPNGE